MAAKKETANGKPRLVGNKSTARKKPATDRRTQPQPPLIKALLAEHRHIATVMQLFSNKLKAIEAGELVDTHVAYEIMDYMVNWPDRFHHPREDLIYSRVAELDPDAADNVDSLQHDHDRMAQAGREVLDTIELWRNGEVEGTVLVKEGRAYIDHMNEHMNSEEKLVFPQIERVLKDEDWLELAQEDELRPLEDPIFGRRVQRDFRNLARRLRRNMRRGVERSTLLEWLGIEAFMESLEVASMAYDSTRAAVGDCAQTAWDDGVELFADSLVTGPLLCAVNNTRLGLLLLQDFAQISRDALGDISRVNQERKDRIRLLDR